LSLPASDMMDEFKSPVDTTQLDTYCKHWAPIKVMVRLKFVFLKRSSQEDWNFEPFCWSNDVFISVTSRRCFSWASA
jgi:hypothetical protein